MTTTSDLVTQLRIVKQQFKQLGLELPSDLTDRLTDLDIRLEQAPAALRVDEDALFDATWRTLGSGADVLADETVREQLLRAQLASMRPYQRIENRVQEEKGALLVEYAPVLLAGVVEHGVPLAQAINEARDQIPGARLDDPRTEIGLRSPALLELWGRARAAFRSLDTVRHLWSVLAKHCGVHPDRHSSPLILADLSAPEVQTLVGVPSGDVTTQAIINSGHELSIATLDEFKARRDRLRADQADDQDRRTREMRTGFREDVIYKGQLDS